MAYVLVLCLGIVIGLIAVSEYRTFKHIYSILGYIDKAFGELRGEVDALAMKCKQLEAENSLLERKIDKGVKD